MIFPFWMRITALWAILWPQREILFGIYGRMGSRTTLDSIGEVWDEDKQEEEEEVNKIPDNKIAE